MILGKLGILKFELRFWFRLDCVLDFGNVRFGSILSLEMVILGNLGF